MPWEQWLILVTGPVAIGLSQVDLTKRHACLVGLCGQAGWFVATWKAAQWGMFAASFVYAAMWGIGLYQHWLKSWLTGGPASVTTPTADLGTTRPRSTAGRANLKRVK